MLTHLKLNDNLAALIILNSIQITDQVRLLSRYLNICILCDKKKCKGYENALKIHFDVLKLFQK